MFCCFLVVDGLCCLLEAGGLLRGMKVTSHVVCESSTSQSSEYFLGDSTFFLCVKVQLGGKILNLPKFRWKIHNFFILSVPSAKQ